jgi:hypothetical protein
LGNNEELYDHSNDPEENINLVGNKDHVAVLERMRKKLEETRNEAQSSLNK